MATPGRCPGATRIEQILDLHPGTEWIERRRCDDVASESELDDKADALRKVWDFGLDPIPSLCELLEEKGIKVVEDDHQRTHRPVRHVVVNDASSLIDLRKGGLLPALGNLPYRLGIPLAARATTGR